MNDKSNCHRSHWLQGLKSNGLKPDMVILEEIRGSWPWQESERYWIKKGKSLGWPLTNNTSGGDGVPDLPKETRERMAQTWVGRKHKESTKKLISQKRKGLAVHSDEHKQYMSDIMKGRDITWGDKISESARKLSEEDIINIKKRLDDGERNKDLALEYGVHRTTLSKIKTGKYGLKYDGKPFHSSKKP